MLQIVVPVLFEAVHDRAILNIVQVQSKRANRALLERAPQISTIVLLIARARIGDQLFYNIDKMEESQRICTIAFSRRVFQLVLLIFQIIVSFCKHQLKIPSKSQTTPCSYGADPPIDGKDFINLNNFNQYQIDGKECSIYQLIVHYLAV